MPSRPVAEGHQIRSKAHRYYIHEVDFLMPSLDQILKQPVVLRQHVQYLPFVGPAIPCDCIEVPVLAFLATELLVLPAIAYLVSAFKTLGHPAFVLLIFHIQNFTCGKYHKRQIPRQQPREGFSFSLLKYFSFLRFLPAIK